MNLLEIVAKVAAKHAIKKMSDNKITQKVVQKAIEVNNKAAKSNNKLISNSAKAVQASVVLGRITYEHQQSESKVNFRFGLFILCAIPAAMVGFIIDIVSNNAAYSWLSGIVVFFLLFWSVQVFRKKLRQESPFLADITDELFKGAGRKFGS